MKTITILMKQHPVLTFFALVFAISWGGLIIMLGPDAITPENTGSPFVLIYLITVAGPSLASVLLTGLLYGRNGFRATFSRLLEWRVAARWYAVALLVAPFSVITSLLALSLTSPAFLPGLFAASSNDSPLLFGFSASEKASFLLFALGLGLFNGFVEEVGWTGFAIPKLVTRYGVPATGLMVGLLWGAWHGLSNYVGSAGDTGALSLFLYLAAMLFSFLPPFRLLMVWIYARTKSLLLAMLMHASLNFFWFAFTPLALTGEQRVTWYLVWAGMLWIVIGVVAMASGTQRAQQPLGRTAA